MKRRNLKYRINWKDAWNEMMEKYLLEKKEEAMYREKSSAVVLWWSPEI